jgi:hypothetical protein
MRLKDESLHPSKNHLEDIQMNQRYIVYDGNDAFASVNATNPDEAIHIACNKTDNHNPYRCTAIPVAQDAPPSSN